MELLAVQRYCPAYVNWTFFKVREDTRAWLRTTTFLSRLYKEEEKEIILTYKQVVLYKTGLKGQSAFAVLLAQMGQMSRR